MFNLFRVAFLTVVNAYRPVFGRPERLSRLVLGPVLLALVFIIVVVPFARQFVLLGLEPQPMPAASVVEQLAHRLPVIAVDMLAVIPWLWLASVLMMKWPHVRRSIAPLPNSRPVVPRGKIWKSTALMLGVCLIVALAFEAFAQMLEYLDASSEVFHAEIEGSTTAIVGWVSLILLSRYGLVLHGLSIGHQISFRESRRRLEGHSYRVFWTLLLVAGAAAYSPITAGQSWFGSVPPDWDSGVAGASTNALLGPGLGLIVSVFMFAFAVCAISEVLARTYSVTAAQPMDSEKKAVSVPA